MIDPMAINPRLGRRGRPRGKARGGLAASTLQQITIKTWRPKYEIVISLHTAGWTNLKIAEHLKMHPVRVSQILRSKQAVEIIGEVTKEMRRRSVDSIIEKMAVLVEDSVDRIGDTLKFDGFVLGSDAKKHQDNLALGFIKEYMPGKKDGAGSKPIPVMNDALGARLLAALEKSDRVEEILNETKGEVKEGEYVVVDSEAAD